ncbi:one cut domain family member 2-like isoform X3 [Haliotis cracherodii]|uniref:one cut domain family member 2-like isoform X3 n=1 Tax=Haliotis cracherodii TaxID=6455 RepID=UPI0039ECFCFC
MTMENMGELPTSDQQISDSSSVSTTAAPASSSTASETEYVSNPELSVSPTSISRADAIPVSVSGMIDSSEFRSQMGEATYHTLNGRMSPNYSPTNSYATLTPLQPLPPISTVSDKFSHVPSSNVSGSFTLMPQNNGIGMDMSPYRYDKISMGMNMGPSLGATPMTMMSNNYQQGLGYGYGQNGIGSPKPESKMHVSPTFDSPYSSTPIRIDPVSARLHSPNPMMSPMNGLHGSAPTPSPHSESPQRDRLGPGCESPNKQQEVEEINTKELAQRISSELKRYSIPQAVFAQRVLCRSQGTLSDLLRNPKPWSKLKSGRETFRRMWKWLQEPEFQRMSALRLAVQWQEPFPVIDVKKNHFEDWRPDVPLSSRPGTASSQPYHTQTYPGQGPGQQPRFSQVMERWTCKDEAFPCSSMQEERGRARKAPRGKSTSKKTSTGVHRYSTPYASCNI